MQNKKTKRRNQQSHHVSVIYLYCIYISFIIFYIFNHILCSFPPQTIEAGASPVTAWPGPLCRLLSLRAAQAAADEAVPRGVALSPEPDNVAWVWRSLGDFWGDVFCVFWWTCWCIWSHSGGIWSILVVFGVFVVISCGYFVYFDVFLLWYFGVFSWYFHGIWCSFDELFVVFF